MTAAKGVVIIGSGFAGIGMGIKLKQAGRHDFVILEKDSDLGGTWRDNTYPGCACDVPSYLYSFSFEQNPRWTRMFSPQDEIWDYLRHCVEKYDLASQIRYDAEVTGARFDETEGCWDVEVNGGETVRGRVLVAGVGALHMPNIPDLPGIENFTGTTFHSAQWNHDHDLAGRKVAVIGTGASAIQFVPQIQPTVEQLDLYQRTPPWVTPKPDRAIPSKEKRFYERFPAGQRAVRNLIYWALEARGTGFALTPKAMKLLEISAKRHLAKQVPDLVLRAKLTPDYQIGCKRILLANDFYPALMQDNVDVVTEGIVQVQERSVVTADGTEREADTIVFGTGFQVSGNLTHMKVVGREGAELNDVWGLRGIGAHLGITMAGFPNLFLLLGPNTALGHSSVVFMIESQIRYVGQALDLLDQSQATYMEVRADTQQDFLDQVQTRLSDTVWESGCKSWYMDENGRNFTIWPHFTWKYWLETRTLDTDDFRFIDAHSHDELSEPHHARATTRL
ncbi:MAG: NAD(P)/FAD-dependent oxidoreductase [Nocardioidaceae bacterium]